LSDLARKLANNARKRVDAQSIRNDDKEMVTGPLEGSAAERNSRWHPLDARTGEEVQV
jgi:hypothetical protein